MKKLLVLFVSVIVLTACGNDSKLRKAQDNLAYDGIAPPPPVMSGKTVSMAITENNLTSFEEKIIRNANIEIAVSDLQNAKSRLSESIKKSAGYISSENESKEYDRIRVSMIIRIPNTAFDSLVNTISNLGDVKNKSISVEDVTATFYDQEQRIKTKKELEKRYLDILSKARTVTEILEVEKQLNEVRSDIESMEGSFKYLSDRIQYSTIELTLYQLVDVKYNPDPRPGFFSRIFPAIAEGWFNLTDFIIGIIYLWPFLLIIVAVIYFFRKWRNRNKN